MVSPSNLRFLSGGGCCWLKDLICCQARGNSLRASAFSHSDNFHVFGGATFSLKLLSQTTAIWNGVTRCAPQLACLFHSPAAIGLSTPLLMISAASVCSRTCP